MFAHGKLENPDLSWSTYRVYFVCGTYLVSSPELQNIKSAIRTTLQGSKNKVVLERSKKILRACECKQIHYSSQSVGRNGPKVLLVFPETSVRPETSNLLSTEPTRTDVMIHRGWVQPAEHMSKQNPQVVTCNQIKKKSCSRQPSVSSLYPFVGSPIS